jgi:hypothetical protein
VLRRARRLILEPLEERRLLAGGGQNILLVVNPDDESALRIANAYQELRGIPDRNVVFITPPMSNGSFQYSVTAAVLNDTFVVPLSNAIQGRGLTDQIDYIATIGEPTRYQITGDYNSFTYGLMLLDVLYAGLNVDNADHVTTGLYDATPNQIAIGDNPGIHHSDHYTVNYGTTYDTQYYMAGAVGYTWLRGNSTDQVIQNLERTVAADGTHPTGTVYFEDNDDIRAGRRYQWGRAISVTAGNGTAGYGGDNGYAPSATLNLPQGMAVDSLGNLYIADTANHRIRKVNTSNNISTVAGTGTAGYDGDGGAATSALLNGPTSIAVNAAGDLFIADTQNHRIRRVDHATGVITTVAGTGTAGYDGDDDLATAAELNAPQGVAVDTSDTVYIADSANHCVRKVTAGVITTVAGTGTAGYGGDNGPATSAALNNPSGLALDAAGNLYICDTNNNRVRKRDAATGTITTMAGNGTAAFAGDNGLATAAALKAPTGVVVDSAGNLFISDSGNNRVRRVNTAGVIITSAGTGVASYTDGNSLATGAALNSPAALAAYNGYVYVADKSNSRVRRLGNEGATQEMLTDRGIPWVYEYSTSNYTPKNQTNVLGAVIGRAGYSMPNGSTYVAGSWADNLTSYGCTWEDRGQTKDSMIIGAGVAATSGSIVEPYLNYSRFTKSSVYVYQADGSTMGEAFAKSVATPDIQLFLGDLLAQPQADIPDVTITAGPAEGATVSGTIALSAAGSLAGAKIATGVEQLELLVDGRTVGTIAAASGTFNLDTTALSDGRHELRVVAINNAAAESEGSTSVNVVVNNHGRSASAAVSSLTLGNTEIGSVDVSATTGDGTLLRIELRHMGRTLGQVNAASGTIAIDASKLAYDENPITPVAVFSDGTEIAGAPIAVTRQRPIIAGQAAGTYKAAGLKAEYFYGKGGTSVSASDFSSTPDMVTAHNRLNLWSGFTYLHSNGTTQNYTSLGDRTLEKLATSNIDRLALRLSGKFMVTASNAGEYQFYAWRTNDSFAIYVDGQKVAGLDGQNGGATTYQTNGVFLGPGEHELVVLAANTVNATNASYFDVSIEYRGPDGVTSVVDSSRFYQTNDAPVLTPLGTQKLASIGEDAVNNPGTLVSTIVGSTISDVNPGALRGIAVTAVASSAGGVWQYRLGATDPWASLGSPSPSAALLLPCGGSSSIRFLPNPGWTGVIEAGITYRAWDITSGAAGGTANTTSNGGNTPFSTATDTAGITVYALNDAPLGGDAARSIDEDQVYVFAASDFGFSDPGDSPANAFTAVKVKTVPAAGELQLDGTVVAAGQYIQVSDIEQNRLTFVPGSNDYGNPYAQFQFQVQDDGGTENGAQDLSLAPNTVTFSVISVSDAPTGTDTTKTVLERSARFLSVADFGFNDAGDRPWDRFQQVWITTLPTRGSLRLGSTAVSAGQAIAVADIQQWQLKYVPDADAAGGTTTSLTFQVQDNGGAVYGANLDPTPNTLTFVLEAVNDAPSGADATRTAVEDVPYPLAAADFGFSDGLDDPVNALRAVKVVTLPAVGSLKLNGVSVSAGQYVAVADINLGRFTFTTAENGNGASYASFTFQVQDDGGTANLGIDLDPTPNTITFNVAAANDPPVVGALTDTPDPVTVGESITLTATGVADPFDAGGVVVRVDFYRESNGTAGLQTGVGGDTLAGTDPLGTDGWSVSVSTAGLTANPHTYYAQAIDDQGVGSVAGTAAASTTNVAHPDYNLDVDGNGTADALTDGILVLRYLFNPTGTWIYQDALGTGATRTTREDLRSFLDGGRATVLDVDGNGTADALTDGILVLRYLNEPAGGWTYSDALGVGATRTTQEAIRAHLDQYQPGAGLLAGFAALAAPAAPVASETFVAEPAPSGVECSAVASEAFAEAIPAPIPASTPSVDAVLAATMTAATDAEIPTDAARATAAAAPRPAEVGMVDQVLTDWDRPLDGAPWPLPGLARFQPTASPDESSAFPLLGYKIGSMRTLRRLNTTRSSD